MFRIQKRFKFEAAHQLENAFTKACSDCIHGHSYTVEMHLYSEHLDDNQMVVDFGVLKAFKSQVMFHWDHGLILHKNKEEHIEPLITAGVLKESKVTFLSMNPTAEAMARLLYEQLVQFVENCPHIVGEMVKVYKVRVHETSTGWAEYKP